ncbi:Sas5p Ecym_8318 [Eremothecium cymbalariae DBVPG|uniref:YEATS domain-containing protein n=1 Tax=Eremothecium cymbalariae (strain CBS 270.75 / DBVPG 7215 / KCTC 17166 / NRRL Y-17582) TaxID=931890 RepID=G8JXM2_ERECY|nr:Hypothetical protein Ecym_8318 [Eremothecium cymbalariae DBVPG\
MEIPTVERVVRVKTQQVIIPEIPLIDGLPIRRWAVEIWVLNESGEEIEADLFESCTYILHPSFEQPKRKVRLVPFRLDEQGWGQFEMKIVARFIKDGGKVVFKHDLVFDQAAYASDFKIRVPYHIEELREVLLQSGPVLQFNYEDQESHPIRIKIPQIVNSLAVANEETINKVLRAIVSYPGVKEALLKRRSRSEEFVLHLGQLPNTVLETIYNITQRQ